MSRFLFLFRESGVTKKTGCSDFKFLVAPLLFFSQLASTIIWAAYLFVFGSGVAVAERVESKHVNERYGFSISYPSPIFSEQITPPDSAVALVLSGQNGFPTFTVAVAEGGYQPISDDAHVAQLLREYKRAGFVDARAVRVSRYTHREVPLQSPLVTILFSTPPEAIAQRCKEGAERVRGEEENSDESSLMQSSRAARSAVNLSLRTKGCEEYIDQKQWLIRSKVVLISTPSRHFVLTYMDFADSGNFEQAITLFNRFKIGLNENQGAGEQVEERSEKADRSPNSYGLMRGLFGWVAPAMTGLVQSSEDTKRYQIEKIDDEASPSLRPFEKIEDSSEIRAQPRWSEFTKIVFPNSHGGQLFGALTLFTSGIILNRLRRR